MGFTGTLEKCKACDKTVYFIELVSADGVPYHKKCFKCSHCNGLLVMSSYSSIDGVLYCKPHYDQLFKETGTFTKKFQPREIRFSTKAPSKLSSMFCGTQDKCAFCKKTAYPLEKVSNPSLSLSHTHTHTHTILISPFINIHVTVEGEFYHKSCFRCSHGGCYITPSSYAALDGILYCKAHFAQLFKQKGSYSYLTKTATMKKNAVNLPAEKSEAEENNETVPEANADANSDLAIDKRHHNS
ncbi:LIM domain-containing protein WLIM2b isoform X1 [Populus alba]|uniref:LIM domain-containing protein WLIM2b isoform X1 n=1 Tax=Populus alba TaxID=43335 RepID=UPI003CC7421A